LHEEIIYADKDLRRRALILTLGLAVFGWWGIELTQSYLHRLEILSETDPYEAARKIIPFVYAWMALSVAAVVAMSTYFFWLGVKVATTDQYPYPGMRVLRDTRIVRGGRARLRAAIALILAAVIVLAGCWAVVFGTRLASSINEEIQGKGPPPQALSRQ
jgi:hypothetical protein